MHTSELLKILDPVKVLNGELAYHYDSLACHTDKVERNSIFAAITVRKDDPTAKRFYAVSEKKEGEYYFDYHQYINKAIELGATAIICEKLPVNMNPKIVYIQVLNVVQSLGILTYKSLFQKEITVIQVTGSSGKTSTVHCLFNVIKAIESNTQKVYTYRPTPISLPAAILNLLLKGQLRDKGILVLEIPTDHSGCIERLTSFTKPNISILLNVLDAHLNIFGSRDEIANAKFEIFKHLNKDGIALLNADNDKISENLNKINPNVKKLLFGNSILSNIKGGIVLRKPYSTIYHLEYNDLEIELETPLLGESGLYIIMAVMSCCISLGFEFEKVVRAFRDYTPMEGRMSWHISKYKELVLYDNSTKTNSVNLTQMINENVQLPWNDGHRILALGTFGSSEHPNLSEETWVKMDYFFNSIFLVGENTHHFFPKAMHSDIKKFHIMEDVSKHIYNLHQNEYVKKLYVTVVGYIPNPGQRSTPLIGIVSSLKELFN